MWGLNDWRGQPEDMSDGDSYLEPIDYRPSFLNK